MEQILSEPKCSNRTIWVDWTQEIVSFHEAAGFEPIPFTTQECWQANIRIFLTAGYRFQ